MEHQDSDKKFEQSEDGFFYEIEYDESPWPGVGKYVLKSVKIQPPPRDEARERFNQMRDLARENRFRYSGRNVFYESQIQKEKGMIFYKQGMFMKDFEDDYDNAVPYSSYYPFYQTMSYEQLRTYFTWRTKVRQGIVEETSLSYAFLYLYELLNNIGVEDPADGLEKLMFFWKEFRRLDQTIDKYVLKWLKDYHVYYELPWTFRDFVTENDLGMYYPWLEKSGCEFDQMCSVSKYDIKKSRFYTEERRELIRDCFSYTLQRLRQAFQDAGMDFDDCIFPSAKSMAIWTPFQGALFFPWMRQRERRVILSENEIYLCGKNSWKHHKTLASESGRKLLGYIMKQMESVLRKITNYKYSITAGISVVNPVTVTILAAEGISLETLITDTVMEFYRETTKTVVRVDPEELNKIRREAMITQEKLTVEEEARDETADAAHRPEKNRATGQESASEQRQKPEKNRATGQESAPEQRQKPEKNRITSQESASEQRQKPEKNRATGQESASEQWLKPEMERAAGSGAVPAARGRETPAFQALSQETNFPERVGGSDPEGSWPELSSVLNSVELGALKWLSRGENHLKQYADQQGIMLEVLADGINEKAMDVMGDSILDEEFAIYEDYLEQVKEMVSER